MRLKSGDKAKNFSVVDIFDRPIRLTDYQGRKLLLSFYRYASCPLCNMRVHELIVNFPRLQEMGLSMLAFFQSQVESIREYVGKQDAPFPIVADPERLVYQEYGVEASWMGFLKGGFRIMTLVDGLKQGFLPGKMEGKTNLVPADFLIGPDLYISKAYYGEDIGDHMPLAQIEEWLRPG